ncbi:ParB/RepB/Spo0J family partition protein [Limnohabitans sp. DM1]|uniref:ParB/RepB/Spo0J family partition protein n=1 Tax=Limnohabitans sp. DM1 TaxID=1597955 RepID=UPI000ABFF8B6|nr:ParB/RepB/Spo0J family partition protein [Limnohabitans sp. DM1]
MKQTPRNKAALIDFENLDQSPKSRPPTFATAPGQALQNSLLRNELEKWSGASPVRPLDPKLIQRSKWANRHELSYQDEEFIALKEDIQSCGGNVQPIKVRPLPGQKDRYEVVFGHRRHQACLDLDIPVLSMIADVDDVELFIDMDRENRQRKDMRPYELGVMYNRALKEKIFPSAKKMSEATGAHLGTMGKALVLARLPDYVIEAFPSPLDLQYRWADLLDQAVKERPEETNEIARSIKGEKLGYSSKEVFERLVGTHTASSEDAAHRVNITGSSGSSAAISVNPSSRSISVNVKNIDPSKAEQLEKLIKAFLG